MNCTERDDEDNRALHEHFRCYFRPSMIPHCISYCPGRDNSNTASHRIYY
jgi:hypothetical protein